MRNLHRIAILVVLFLSINSLTGQTVDTVYEDGKLYVKIKDGATNFFNNYDGNPLDLSPDILPLQSTYGITKISRPFIVYGGLFGQKTYEFEFTNISAINGLISDLVALSYIEYAEKVPILKLSLVTNDPDFNAGSLSATNWHLKKINAETAWNINTGSAAIIVAVIDNEIQQNHPDLIANLWTNPLDPIDGLDNDGNGIVDDFNGADFADMDGNTNPNILLNHGTHCAGIAVGATNNGLGISSIGFNCRLMPLKATSDFSPFPTSINMTAAINCIFYATAHSANVISMSFATFGFSTPLATATNNAIANNITVVAAAGNNGGLLTLFPAGNPGVIGVAATDYSDLRAPFSNFGPAIDVCAPGVSIYSTNSTFQPTPVNGYDFKSGTSMSTPLVAGLCGLILTQNPALTPAQVQNCLTSTATNIDAINPGFAGNLGAGRINAPQAILCAGNTFNSFFVTDISDACPGGTINLTGFSNATGILSWNWTFSPAPATIVGNTTPNVAVTFAAPGPVTVTLTVVTGSGSFVYTQTAYLNIGGPSATFVSPAAGAICDGSAQQLIINFQNAIPPINYTISNGYTTETFTTNDLSTSYFFRADINYPLYTVAINANPTNCASIVNPQINLNIINCCQNLIANGDFELGNTAFSSDNFITCTTPAGTIPQGLASVFDGSPAVLPNTIFCTAYGFGGAANHRNAIFGLDTRCGANEAGTMLIQAPLPFNTPAFQSGFTSRLWFQTNVPLVAGDNYNVDYFTASSGGGGGYPFMVRFEVLDAGGTPIFTSGNYVTQADYAWHQFSFVWNNTYTGLATVQLVQVDYFANTFYDISVDDISIRRTNTPPLSGAAYAGADVTLCNGSSIMLSGSGEPVYLWGPATGLSNVSIAQPTASPTTTTTYTLTVTNGCGTSTDMVNVIVIPAPIVNASASLSTICAGSSTNLTATGAVSYSWLPTTGLSSSIISNPVATPGVTTTYTVTGTALNGCTATATITVTVNPTPTGNSVSNISTCVGTTVGASSFSSTPTGATYTWTNSNTAIGLGPNGVSNVPSFIATNSGTTPIVATITVTPTLGGCTGATFSYTITVNPLPIVTFGSIPNPCSGGPAITLTTGSPAGGVYSGPNVSGGIFTPPVVTSSTPYIITYTFTDGTTGCTNSATQTITVDVCAGPCGICNEMAPSGILSVSPPQYNVYCITTPMTISGTVTIALSEVQIAPTITITVPSGSTLNIYGSHLYSCADMWQGIIVQPGGRINVIYYGAIVPGVGLTKRSPMIEDARTAIDIQAGSTLTTGILNISNATFNRNEYSIKINGYSPILTPYPFSVVSSVFTCRDIGFVSGSLNWPLTNTIRTAPTPPSPLQTPYINSATYFESTAAAFLKPPFTPGISKSQTAILLNSVGTVVNPATTPTWYEIKIGTNGLPRYNVFDNHVICIDAFNSNFTCVNNVFQNTIGTNNGGGVAINATAKELNFRAQVIAGTPTGLFNNKFFDCSRSINTTNYFENIFKYCDVRSTQAGPLSPPPPAPPTATNPLPLANHRGQHGFFVLTNRFRVIDMSDNKLYNVENGITFNANFGPYNIGGVYSSASGQYSGQVNVDRNEIAPHLPTYTIVDQYVRSAISLSNVIASGLQVIAGTDIRSNSNTISNVHRAVFTTNWTKKNVITNSNIITLRTDLYSNIATQFGVAHISNSGATSFGNSINANNVTGTSIFANVNIRGIITSRCIDQRVACNIVNGTTHGIEFASSEPNTRFDNNSMTNHKYGYVLSSNGIIGLQGTNSNPSDNAWFGAWTGFNFKTATLSGSSAQNSKMYIRTSSTSQFNPNGSGTTTSSPITDLYNFTNGSLIVSTTPVPYLGCAVIVGGGGGGGMPGSAIALLEDIAQDNISFVKNLDETKYINKNQLYRLLKADPSLTASSTILQDFYAASVPTVRETYTNIEDDIASGDIVNGQSKTTALAPVNTIEDNYKTFFNAYLKHQTDTILESDSMAIVDMANGCPFTDGDVVYQARALYNSIYRTNVYFEDNCPEIPERSFNQVKNTTTSSFDVLVYPNPNSGSFSLVPFSSDIKELNIKVIDVNGKTVYEKTIDSGDRMFNISFDAQNGVYMLFVNNTKTNENIVKRIVIQK